MFTEGKGERCSQKEKERGVYRGKGERFLQRKGREVSTEERERGVYRRKGREMY